MVSLSSSHLSSICPAILSISTFKCTSLKTLGIPRVFFPIFLIALRFVQDDLLVGISFMCTLVRFFSTLSKRSWNTEISIVFALKMLSQPYFLWEVPDPTNVNGNGSGKLLPNHSSSISPLNSFRSDLSLWLFDINLLNKSCSPFGAYLDFSSLITLPEVPKGLKWEWHLVFHSLFGVVAADIEH